MIEINSEVINSEVLFERVKSRAMMMNIDSQFYNEIELSDMSNIITSKKLHEAMLLVYQNLQGMNATWEIHENVICSNRPVIGKAIVFFKRAFRKIVRWLYTPFIQQQIMFNGATVRTVSDMIKLQELIILECEQRERKEQTNEY